MFKPETRGKLTKFRSLFSLEGMREVKLTVCTWIMTRPQMSIAKNMKRMMLQEPKGGCVLYTFNMVYKPSHSAGHSSAHRYFLTYSGRNELGSSDISSVSYFGDLSLWVKENIPFVFPSLT